MFDLDGGIVGQMRMVHVKSFDDASGVGDAVEEIRITKRDVLRACRNLLSNVGQNYVERDYAELAFINGNDGAMAAQMFAAAGRFDVSGYAVCAIRQNDVRVSV